MSGTHWTAAELATLRKHYAAKGAEALAKMLPTRSRKALQRKAHDLKIPLLPETLARLQREQALRCAPPRAGQAYQMRCNGASFGAIAQALGYSNGGASAASVIGYCKARGLALPVVRTMTVRKPRPSRAKPKELHKSRAPYKKRTKQATRDEARLAPSQKMPRADLPAFIETPEQWLARNKPRQAELVALDAVLSFLTAAGYAPRRCGKNEDGARYYIKGYKPPLPPRTLVDLANRWRIARDNGATQWVVSGLYAQPAGMLPRDCRPSVLRNAA